MGKTIKIHNEAEFAKMRAAGRLGAEILDFITPYVVPGVSTGKLDELCAEETAKAGAISAPLHYNGFPKSICTSVNHVVCHGIPSEDKILHDGDILNIDVTVKLDGWHGDTSRMFYVGKPKVKARRLCQVTYEAMMAGIEKVKPGNTLTDVARAIQTVAEKAGFSVVRDYCGHGVGQVFHDEPQVLHYVTHGRPEVVLQEGMIFTIEPMLNEGGWETITNSHDGWTVTTRDKSLSAQFEHSLGVTKDGYEIFTLSPKGWYYPPYEI